MPGAIAALASRRGPAMPPVKNTTDVGPSANFSRSRKAPISSSPRRVRHAISDPVSVRARCPVVIAIARRTRA
jgi:hypothetical protein